jgi:DNA polymerase-3 subunit delta'
LTAFNIETIQPRAWQLLSRSFQAKRLASTYLFHGPDGTGHWPMAISLAALVNCERPASPKKNSDVLVPCKQCVPCRMIFGLQSELLHPLFPVSTHKNIDELNELIAEGLEARRKSPFQTPQFSGTTTIPISMTRDLQSRLSLKIAQTQMRVVIFSEMEKMFDATADALLKLIEEPPANTIIILTAERSEGLLPTIASRSQKIKLGRIPETEGIQFLMAAHSVSEQRAKLLFRIADGSLGRAAELVQHTDEESESSQRAVGMLLFQSLVKEPSPVVINRVADLLDKDKGGTEALLRLWQSLITDCSAKAYGASDDRLVNIDFSSEISACAHLFADPSVPDQLGRLIKFTLADLRRNVHIQNAITALVLRMKWVLEHPATPAAGLYAR